MPSNEKHDTNGPKVKMVMPEPPVFTNKLEEREYLKGRLAAAFRIFGKNGYDEGMPRLLYTHKPFKYNFHTDLIMRYNQQA